MQKKHIQVPIVHSSLLRHTLNQRQTSLQQVREISHCLVSHITYLTILRYFVQHFTSTENNYLTDALNYFLKFLHTNIKLTNVMNLNYPTVFYLHLTPP